MDTPGIEPGAFRMQIERDTTTPHTLIIIVVSQLFKSLISIRIKISQINRKMDNYKIKQLEIYFSNYNVKFINDQ